LELRGPYQIDFRQKDIIAAGTFLNGLFILGSPNLRREHKGEFASKGLGFSIWREIGFRIWRLKNLDFAE